MDDMAEDNTSILMRIHAAYPEWTVTRIEGGAWQALVRTGPATEHVIVRHDLADLETRIDVVSEKIRSGVFDRAWELRADALEG